MINLIGDGTEINSINETIVNLKSLLINSMIELVGQVANTSVDFNIRGTDKTQQLVANSTVALEGMGLQYFTHKV